MNVKTISPVTTIVVFFVSVALMFANTCLSFVRLGPAGHLSYALGLGGIVAGLDALFFMHLIKSQGRVWVFAFLGLFWLGIMLTLTMNDYMARPHASY